MMRLNVINKRTISFAVLWILGGVGIMVERPESGCAVLFKNCNEAKGFWVCDEQDFLVWLSEIRSYNFQMKRLKVSRLENRLKVDMDCTLAHSLTIGI